MNVAENMFTEEWLAQRLGRIGHGSESKPTAKAAEVIAHGSKPLTKANGHGFDPFVALCAANNIPAPATEYRFIPGRQFRADYAWLEQKLIVERQGGLFSQDERAKRAHAMPLKILRDYEKSNLAQLAGWTYLQFTPEQLDKGAALAVIKIRLGVG
jgi:hypothetical protein